MTDQTARPRQELIEALGILGIKSVENDLGGGDVGVIVLGRGGSWSFVCGNAGVLDNAWSGEFHRKDGSAQCTHTFNSVHDLPSIVAWTILEKFILKQHREGDEL